MNEPIIVGAVLYDPKVSIIWDIIREFFERQGVPMDVVFYTNYELQVEALAKGHVEIAWNSPLAWLDSVRKTKCRAIAMRDTDRDRVSHVVVRKGSGVEKVSDLEGKTVAAGAIDSPQAHLIPIEHLLKQGINFEVQRFDLLVGKHGDHVGGELEAFRCLERGEAAACCMIDLNWASWNKDGTVDGDQFAILTTTEPYDHCVFTVRDDFDPSREKRWLDALYSMSYDEPSHRQMMDMEGLKKWEPGRTTGFGPLTRAVEMLRFFNR
jgi:phosphonate transport system substrate-binding protein